MTTVKFEISIRAAKNLESNLVEVRNHLIEVASQVDCTKLDGFNKYKEHMAQITKIDEIMMDLGLMD
jgi:hypothetical protein